MKRLLLASAIVVLSGCAAPTQPETAMQPARSPSPPRILHRLVLVSPPAEGVLELRRESRVQAGAEAVTYRAYGAIVMADDLGQWRFAYTTTSLEGVGPVPGEWIGRLHALSVILTSAARGGVEVDWERSMFVDPTGQTHRIIHRGVQLNQLAAPMIPSIVALGATLNEFVFPAGGVTFSASGGRPSLWNAPAVFERLAPGSGFSIVLAIKSGDVAAPRTFRFSAVAPPPA